ncbi:hypothetical protein EJB05_33749, partial [Eragrostis curvula]
MRYGYGYKAIRQLSKQHSGDIESIGVSKYRIAPYRIRVRQPQPSIDAGFKTGSELQSLVENSVGEWDHRNKISAGLSCSRLAATGSEVMNALQCLLWLKSDECTAMLIVVLMEPLKKLAENPRIALFAIDEVHYDSKWGHHFQAEYSAVKASRGEVSSLRMTLPTGVRE